MNEATIHISNIAPIIHILNLFKRNSLNSSKMPQVNRIQCKVGDKRMLCIQQRKRQK